jgi:Protein of unknown function (DUF3110)
MVQSVTSTVSSTSLAIPSLRAVAAAAIHPASVFPRTFVGMPAFVAPGAVSFGKAPRAAVQAPRALRIAGARCARRPPQRTTPACCAGAARSAKVDDDDDPPHPWGNGGLNNVADYEGFEAARELASFADEKAAFAAYKAARGNDDGLWAVLYNADMIMWDNNLVEANVKYGLNLNLDGLRAFRIVEEVVRQQCFEEKVDKLWVLRCEDGGLLSSTVSGVGVLLLSYEKKDDADRFAMQMDADGRGLVTVESMPLPALKDVCKAREMLIGLVAPSFVQPSHFGGHPSQPGTKVSL